MTGIAPIVGVHTEFCRAPLHPGPCAGWKAAKAAGRDHTVRHDDLIPQRTRRRHARAAAAKPAAKPADLVQRARERQRRIDAARDRAQLLAEIEQRVILNEEPPPRAHISALQMARRLGVDTDPTILSVINKLLTGDPEDVDAAVGAAAAQLGLERIGGDRGQVVQTVRFNPREHRALDRVDRGQLVEVVEPGYAQIVDGDRIILHKATVASAEEGPDQTAAAVCMADMHEFCRAPLHPGPCKGWKNAAKAAAGIVHTPPVAAPKPSPAIKRAAPRVKPQVPFRVAEKDLLAARGGKKESRQLSTGDNASVVHLVTFGDGSKAVVKRPKNRDSAKDEIDAEQLGAKVAQALGLRAPNVYRTKDDQAYFDFVDSGKLAETIPEINRGWGTDNIATGAHFDSPDGRRIGLLDTLIENPDRHTGNWFVQDDGSLTPIDHGLGWSGAEDPHLFPADRPTTIGAFGQHYISGTGFEGEWRDNDLSPEYAAAVRDKIAALKPTFEQMDRTDLFDRMMARMDIIAAHAKGTVTP